MTSNIAIRLAFLVIFIGIFALCQAGLIRLKEYKVLQENDLYDKINPNTASWPSLSRLPGISYKKAQMIIAYRQGIQEKQPGRVVFQHPYDLEAITGIGPATVEKIHNYLDIK